jgi:hypothetical protein
MHQEKKQVWDILNRLTKENKERWFLTYVMIQDTVGDNLRREIFRACPATFDRSISIETQIEDLIARLKAVQGNALDTLIPSLRASTREVREQILELMYYKDLYERFHRLNLTIGPIIEPSEDIELIVDECNKALAAAGSVDSPKIDTTRDIAWIKKLRDFVSNTKFASPAETGQRDVAPDLLDQFQRRLQPYLAHLNRRMLDSAKRVSLQSLSELGSDPSADYLSGYLQPLELASRNLNPTVRARAFVCSMWLEACNEFEMIGDVLDVPSTVGDFTDVWGPLKSRVRWLTELEPDTMWSKAVNKKTEKVDNILNALLDGEKKEELFGHIQSLIETTHQMAVFVFAEVMKNSKLDALEAMNAIPVFSSGTPVQGSSVLK